MTFLPGPRLPASVYRLFDADGHLLYVGMSCDPLRRWSEHARKAWWAEVARLELEPHGTWEEAAEAEALAIRREAPAHSDPTPETPRFREGADVRLAALLEGAPPGGLTFSEVVQAMAGYMGRTTVHTRLRSRAARVAPGRWRAKPRGM